MIFKINIKDRNNRGVTLTELIVASVMIGIVMLGVGSFSVAIKSLQRSTSKTTLVAMRAKSAMAILARDAMMAVGDAQDMGVYVWDNGSDQASACFRHDVLITPDVYSDDRWTCWWHGSSYHIRRCPDPTYIPPPGCSSNAQCCGGAAFVEDIILLADSMNQMVTVEVNAAGQLEYIGLNIIARFDPLSPMHPVDNPEYQIVTQISPQGHSR